MNKTARFIALTGILVFSLFGAFAAQERPDAERYPTGLIPPTAEQLEEIHTAWPRIIKVNINRLGYERINAARAAKGKARLSPSVIKPIGHETESSIGIPEEGEPRIRMTSDIVGDLPVVVDNSQTPHFPPIRSQSPLGSCASFSTTYTQLSYMTAFQRDLDITDNNDNTNKYSPKWSYNMLNGGSDSGSSIYNNYKLLEKHGAATWAEFPYDSNYRAWCMAPVAWRNALGVRINPGQYLSGVNTDAAIGTLKELLTNGYVLSFGTYVYSWQFTTIPNDPSTTDDDPEVGKSVAFWENGMEGGHGMVIVGYNDAIWTDVNGNGLVDAGEKGAFRIANSWGPSWRDSGLTWLAYDALKPVSAVAGGPSAGRQQAFHNAIVYVFTARNNYSPWMIAEFTVNHAKRNQLALKLGFSDTAATTPSWTWTPMAINYQGGEYAFDGTTTPTDGTFVYDFSDLLQSAGTLRRYYLGMSDSATGDIATLSAFKIVDLTTVPETELVSGLVPLYADNQQNIYSYIDHTYAGPVDNHQPVLESGQVNPPSGTTLDTYVFWVWYNDIDHDVPSIKNVYIDGTPYAMTAHPNYQPYNGWYYYVTSMSVGTHSFRFHFEDGRGGAVFEPYAGAFSGPAVLLPHVVMPPTAPTGEATPVQGKPSIYSTGGSNCGQGHDVQYRFDWGDGAVSDWLPVGQTSASHVWGRLGTFEVRAQARCSVDTAVESAWSNALAIEVGFSPKVDFDSDGQEDILWRYYGTGGRNRAWFLGNTDPLAEPLLSADPEMEGSSATIRSRGEAADRVLRDPGMGLAVRRTSVSVSDPRDAVPEGKWMAGLMSGANPAKPGVKMPEMDATSPLPSVVDPEFATSTVDPPGEESGNQTKIMATTGVLGGADILAVSDLTWHAMGTGDFNGDGKTDALWRYNGTGGRVRVWYMDGLNVTAGADIGSVSDLDWQIVGTGDFNQDGHVDLLWHHGVTGRVRVWYLDGVSIISGADISTVADLNWKVMGTGDFNGDGHVDLLWRHSVSGRNRVWFMNGVSILSGADLLGVTDQTWQIAGTGDYNNDGHVDLIWRYNGPGGYVYIWYLNGTNWIGTEKLIPVTDQNWKIVSR